MTATTRTVLTEEADGRCGGFRATLDWPASPRHGKAVDVRPVFEEDRDGGGRVVAIRLPAYVMFDAETGESLVSTDIGARFDLNATTRTVRPRWDAAANDPTEPRELLAMAQRGGGE